MMRKRSFIASVFWASLFLGTNGTSYEQNADEVESMIRGIESASRNVVDSRSYGVSYEATLADYASYLRTVAPGDNLDDLFKPGHHTLRLNCEHETSNKFLSIILHARLDDVSTWDIEVLKEEYYPPTKLNLTLVRQFIQTAPTITSLRWSSVDQIPRDLLQAIEQHHPTAKLHYNSLFNSETHYSEQEQYKFCQDEAKSEVVFRDSQDMDRYKDSKIERERIRCQKMQQEKEERKQNREALVSSGTLYSLTVGPGHENLPYGEKIALVHRLLTSCPNLRELKLAMGETQAYVGGHIPIGLNFEVNNQTLAPLESLDLIDYPFKSERDGRVRMYSHGKKPKIVWLAWSWVRRPLAHAFGYHKFQEPNGMDDNFAKGKDISLREGARRTNLDYWLEQMDWSKLQVLKLHNADAYELEKLAGDVLSSLTTVGFEKGDRNAILQFLGNISQSLESIAITSEEMRSPDDILDVVCEKHAKNLKKLAVRHVDILFDPDELNFLDESFLYPKTAFLNEKQLKKILKSFPGLQSLDIDFRIGRGFDYGVLDTLTNFEALTELKLVIDDFARWRTTESEDHEAWMSKVGIKGYLRREKKGAEFTKLEVSFAEYKTGSHC